MALLKWVVEGPNERIAGGYVYLLLCRDEQNIYVKVGRTIRPEKRFHELKNGCPVTPRSFSVVPVPGPEFASRMEQALHATFDKWRVAGEWFRMTASDKEEFNKKLQSILADHSIPLWRMALTKVSATYLVELAKKREAFWKKKYKSRGRAYRDFVSAGGGH